jgi:hypothetical protein
VKLVVPYVGELQPVDSRMIRLAEFLGVSCESLPLERQIERHSKYLERVVPDRHSCFVVNPRVMKEWVGSDTLPADLVSCLLSRFSHLIVHSLRQNACGLNFAAALSRGRVQSVHAVDGMNSLYEIAKNSKDVCGEFSGLSFGPVNPANDHVFSCGSGDPAMRTLISIGGGSFMAVLEREGTEIFFLASEDVANLDAEVSDSRVIEYFSRLVPHAMALRHIFGEECWRPCQSYASVIMDDPLLARNYGYLNFESLLRLMNRIDFHTTVAFIPRNFRRSSPKITRMFRENASRYALCFHGNDHTGAELASTDSARLNTMIQIAERRMNAHRERTGLACDKVMVFPQGKFSIEAMQVLKTRNFLAAANTVPHPANDPVRLTLRDLTQPAVLRYAGFPLFLRKKIPEVRDSEVAFNLFFGKPVLVVTHHDDLQRPGDLSEAASIINSVGPDIRWANIATAVSNSILKRRASDGACQIRSYSGAVRISNDSDCVERFSIEWDRAGAHVPVDHVFRNETRLSSFEVNDSTIRAFAKLAPGDSETFSVVYRNERTSASNLGLQWNAKAFLRRRLSEIRDNYLSKSPALLGAAKSLQRHVLH